eukprot:4016577-Prymnesium_polylepis.1
MDGWSAASELLAASARPPRAPLLALVRLLAVLGVARVEHGLLGPLRKRVERGVHDGAITDQPPGLRSSGASSSEQRRLGRSRRVTPGSADKS